MQRLTEIYRICDGACDVVHRKPRCDERSMSDHAVRHRLLRTPSPSEYSLAAFVVGLHARNRCTARNDVVSGLSFVERATSHSRRLASSFNRSRTSGRCGDGGDARAQPLQT